MSDLQVVCYFIGAMCIMAISTPIVQGKRLPELNNNPNSLSWLLLAHASFVNAMIGALLIVSVRRGEVREIAVVLAQASLIAFFVLSILRYVASRKGFALIGTIVGAVGFLALLTAKFV